MINKLIFQGRLTKEPELRTTNSGKLVCSFSLAQNERYGDTEQTLYLDCVAWSKNAEFISRHFGKGQEMLVEGRISTRKWQDKEGNNRTATELVVDRAHFCGKREESKESYRETGFAEMGDDDRLPF